MGQPAPRFWPGAGKSLWSREGAHKLRKGSVMQTSDIHWLSGLVEGEGSFFASCGSVRMDLTMTDLDVMQRAGKILTTKVNGPYANGPEGRKPRYRTTISGSKAVGWAMILYSQLGERRRTKIRELLAVWRTKRPGAKGRHVCLNGHSLIGSENVRQCGRHRICRQCAAERQRDYRSAQNAIER